MSHHQRARRGIGLIWAMAFMLAVCSIITFSVDFARVRVAKAQLQQAADAAVMYSAAGLQSGVTAVQARAIDAADDNTVDGAPVTIANSDIEFGVWDPAARTFAVLSGAARSSATAVRVTARKNLSLTFASYIGRATIDLESVATATRGKSVNPTISAQGCLWLAGMPNNSTVAATGGNPTPSRAPAQSPTAVTGLQLAAGNRMVFRQASGSSSWGDGSGGTFGPDGNPSWIVTQAAANGINSTSAPIGALVGIFLDARAPNTYSQAASMNFTTSASRNFNSLSPGLKQVFFVGDGLNSAGALQEFVVPSGATRLYLGVMDENGWWWDNTGTFTSSVLDDNVTLVK